MKFIYDISGTKLDGTYEASGDYITSARNRREALRKIIEIQKAYTFKRFVLNLYAVTGGKHGRNSS